MVKTRKLNASERLDRAVEEEELRRVKQNLEEKLGHKMPPHICICFDKDGELLFIPTGPMKYSDETSKFKLELETIATLQDIGPSQAREQCSGTFIKTGD